MLSTPKTKETRKPHFDRSRAFTLVELLMAMGLVAILAAITFGIMGGVRDAQARTQAKAEMAVIAQALESFKSLYGDYPYVEETSDTDNANELLVALTGWSELVKNGSNQLEMTPLDSPRSPFVDTDLLNFPEDVIMPSGSAPGSSVYLVDPWDNPYIYIYNVDGGSWENFGYILMSSGPDGIVELSGVESDGIIDQDWRELGPNNDNIYMGDY